MQTDTVIIKAKEMDRDVSLDVTRGIGILLVILGHCPEMQSQLTHFIFSFHMPLFFLISGFLYKPKAINESLKKDFKNLMLPYFVTCLAVVLFYALVSLATGELNSHVLYYIKATFIGSGSTHQCRLLADLPSIGAIWFLPALFICKNIYNVFGRFQTVKKLMLALGISVLATFIGRNIIFIPMSVLSGLSAIVFYAIGDALKNVRNIHPAIWVAGIFCYTVSLIFSDILIVQPKMDFYPFNVIGAITMSLVIYLIARKICGGKENAVARVLSWMGAYSLTILCFHIIEQDCGVTHALTQVLGGTSFLTFICRVAFPLVAAFAFKKAYYALTYSLPDK